MPFITNDFHHLLVDDEDFERNPEKYKYYVIARRLLITSNTSFTVKYLNERFKKYGDIESTKILQSKLEGFVTFTCDRHACLAFDWEKDKCADRKVRVDSTWHQPDEAVRIDSEWNTDEYDGDDFMELDDSMKLDNSMELNDSMELDETVDSEKSSPLLSLDDGSLFILFDRCDKLSLLNLTRTCRRLEQLLKNGNYYFPNQKSFGKNFGFYNWSFIEVENVFQLMGRYFEKLKLNFKEDESLDTILGYVRLIVKYCHCGKVKDLFFVMERWKNEVWLELRPILKNLSKLEVCIYDYQYEEVTVDFTELCPKLETLILSERFIVEKSLKAVPNLKTFNWACSWSMLLNELTAFEFFYANRQLKVFESRSYFNFEDVTQTTVLLLPNIETLTLFEEEHQVSGGDVLSLQNFKNLRSLTLSFYWNSAVNKAEIIDSCGRLSNLSELKLYFSELKGEKEPIPNLSERFVHLERLELLGIMLDEHVILDFVRKASKIKVMHFHECHVFATESLLAQLRHIMGESSQRCRSECSLYIGNKLNNHFVAVNNREVKCIRWACKHRLWYSW